MTIPTRNQAVRAASLAVVLTAWELYGRTVNPILFTYASAIATAFRELATDIYIKALYSTPTEALVPLIVLWFGFGTPAKVVIVFLFTVLPILINTQHGVKSVDAGLLEVARSFWSSERQLWGDVILPSALPFIAAGFRLAIGRGLVGMVIAEFCTSIAGLGYMIVRYANAFDTAMLFVPVVVLTAMGVLLV